MVTRWEDLEMVYLECGKCGNSAPYPAMPGELSCPWCSADVELPDPGEED